jgi:uncharacterized membrane protein
MIDVKGELKLLEAEAGEVSAMASSGIRSGMKLWALHPHVRTGNQLTLGERAADWMKHWFGTWIALGLIGGIILFWIVAQSAGIKWDPYPFILLNLCLSCLAAVQGIILQISANRGDRINAELQTNHVSNTLQISELLKQNTELTKSIAVQTDMLSDIHAHVKTLGGCDGN